MQRVIVGFYQDENEDWVAKLDCGHGCHVRHNPPLEDRPWATRWQTRLAFLGQVLDCPKCDPDWVTCEPDL